MPTPNLVLLGAPKCGTSSLYDWLMSHPHVSGSGRKETFYMMDVDNPLRDPVTSYRDHGLPGYERLFKDRSAPVLADATSHYLYQDTALRVLSTLPHPAHLVVLVRRPADRVLSSFNYTKHNRGRVESGLSFSEYADALLEGRCQDFLGKIHSAGSAYVLARELDYSQYVNYLVRWREAVPADRLHVYVLEQVKNDPRRVLAEICGFMGIDPTHYDEFEFVPQNRTSGIRWPALHRTAMATARLVPMGRLRGWIKRAYTGAQRSDPPSTSQMDLWSLRRLDEYFEPSVGRLESELGLDLSRWRGERSGDHVPTT